MNIDIVSKDIKSLLDNKQVFILLILSSLLSVFIANLLYFTILKNPYTKSYIVAALVFTSPMFTLLLSYFVLKEGVTYMAVLGVVLIITGVIALTFH
jgi:uncharacterized membrane protein